MAQQWGLTEREARAWHGFHHLRIELMAALTRQLARDSGISLSDYEVLLFLAGAPEHRKPAVELRRLLRWDKTRLSHHLSRMQQRGLLERHDVRPTGQEVILTEHGQATIEQATPRHLAAAHTYFLDVLNVEQLDTLAAISEQVLTTLADLPAEPDNSASSRGRS